MRHGQGAQDLLNVAGKTRGGLAPLTEHPRLGLLQVDESSFAIHVESRGTSLERLEFVESPPRVVAVGDHIGDGLTVLASKIDEARQFGFDITVQESTTCCFAVQDKVWINDGEIPWEWYTVLEDAPQDTSLVKLGGKPLITVEGSGNVCGPDGCC